MYFAEPYYGYTPTQNPFYHPNMLAQQGHAFLADRSFSSPPPCLYSSHQQHAFTAERRTSQASSSQNTYQPAYNLPPNQVQRKPATCGEPKFVSQELSPRIASSLPAYFRVKQNLTGQNGRRCRKSRTVFTELQLRILEKTFCDYKYLDTAHRSKIAHTLNLNETQVKTWFQNRRMKWKRESPEAEGTIAMERVKAKDCEIRTETNSDKNQSINFASF